MRSQNLQLISNYVCQPSSVFNQTILKTDVMRLYIKLKAVQGLVLCT